MKKEKGYYGSGAQRVRYIEVDYDGAAVGQRIRECRERLGMNRYELVAELGIGFDTLGRIERGERDARSEILCRMSEVFCVPVDILLKGEKEEGYVLDDLMCLIKKTTYTQQRAVVELAKAFRMGE